MVCLCALPLELQVLLSDLVLLSFSRQQEPPRHWVNVWGRALENASRPFVTAPSQHDSFPAFQVLIWGTWNDCLCLAFLFHQLSELCCLHFLCGAPCHHALFRTSFRATFGLCHLSPFLCFFHCVSLCAFPSRCVCFWFLLSHRCCSSCVCLPFCAVTFFLQTCCFYFEARVCPFSHFGDDCDTFCSNHALSLLMWPRLVFRGRSTFLCHAIS